MNYSFPYINHINQVLPYIENKPEFLHMKKDDYDVIDYVYQDNNTFPAPIEISSDPSLCFAPAILRDCRGLIFDKNGVLVSRSFHKFFNYGEKPEEQKRLDTVAYVSKKLDGSMIRPLLVNGKVRLATRKGITEVAMQAEDFIADKPEYTAFITHYVKQGYTPIFEWCSRRNQIILDYPEDNLTLLAVRGTFTGFYLPLNLLQELGEVYNIPVVESNLSSLMDTVTKTKDLTEEEGYVIVFSNGHRLKVKSDWYVLLHKTKELIGRKKDIIKLILEGGVDDLLPLLQYTDREEVLKFQHEFWNNVELEFTQLKALYLSLIKSAVNGRPICDLTQKEFALKVLELEPKYRPIMFRMHQTFDYMDVIKEVILKACCNNNKLKDAEWLFGNIQYKGT